jgi:hypothetical protein
MKNSNETKVNEDLAPITKMILASLPLAMLAPSLSIGSAPHQPPATSSGSSFLPPVSDLQCHPDYTGNPNTNTIGANRRSTSQGVVPSARKSSTAKLTRSRRNP